MQTQPEPQEYVCRSLDLRSLLTLREQSAVKMLSKIFRKRFGRNTSDSPNLIANLQDNPANRLTWSATSSRIPTLRLSRSKFWHFASKRWLTAREKLATLGFPVDEATAASMGVPLVPVSCTKQAAAVAGNCMSLAAVTVVQLVGLCCFELVG